MLKSKLRKVTVILTIIMLMTLTLGLVTACGGNPSDSTTSYKVTFYDGTTVITTETVKEGKKIENFVPADKGYTRKVTPLTVGLPPRILRMTGVLIQP